MIVKHAGLGQSKLHDIAKHMALMLGSILFCLLVLEMSVRFIEPREIMRYFFTTSDPVLHHRFIPSSKGHYKTMEFNTEYTINSLGLRDKEYPIEKPANTVRILMVGDSFTEGDGVNSDETFSKRLEAMLNSPTASTRYEVINAGMGSYSPLLEYLYLKHEGLRLNPDLVILNFDLSDIYDDIQYTKRAQFDSTHIPVAVSPAPETSQRRGSTLARIKDFLKEHTRLYNFFRIRIDRFLRNLRHEVNTSGDIRDDKYAILRKQYPPADDRDWALSYHYILLIRDLLRARGVGLWVTVYPYGLQVSPREWHSGRQFWGFKTNTVYSTKPQEYIEQFCHREHILVLNMCEDFKAAARSRFPLYLDYNGHWMAAGHQVAAQVLYTAVSLFLQTRAHSSPHVLSSIRGRTRR